MEVSRINPRQSPQFIVESTKRKKSLPFEGNNYGSYPYSTANLSAARISVITLVSEANEDSSTLSPPATWQKKTDLLQ